MAYKIVEESVHVHGMWVEDHTKLNGRDSGEVNDGRFSPKNKCTQLADEVENEARWGRKGAGGPVCSSPNKNKSPIVYYGPVLADVERTMQTARKSATKMLENSMGKGGVLLGEQMDEQINGGVSSLDSMVIIGRKRELNGEMNPQEKLQASQYYCLPSGWVVGLSASSSFE
ncbi:hypothetical protein FH972_025007 [Carpinus fangiana]|uniref:Uncharacterized protein n=1 Tax=Carpinus fangiana TaxID=176857 RepID=A0A5N6L0N7_9ROSI|nr:hypothetical protein FH972_025007 [Carpinus fangiana]